MVCEQLLYSTVWSTEGGRDLLCMFSTDTITNHQRSDYTIINETPGKQQSSRETRRQEESGSVSTYHVIYVDPSWCSVVLKNTSWVVKLCRIFLHMFSLPADTWLTDPNIQVTTFPSCTRIRVLFSKGSKDGVGRSNLYNCLTQGGRLEESCLP